MTSPGSTVSRARTSTRPGNRSSTRSAPSTPAIRRGGQGVSAVIRTRRPVLVARATEADLRAAAQNAEQLALFRQLGPKSWIVTPLVAHDRVLGAMTLALTESGRRYGPMDLASATVVASHAATMIENARLYRDAQAARRAAEAANRTKDEFLSTLSHELRNPLNAVYGWATLI